MSQPSTQHRSDTRWDRSLLTEGLPGLKSVICQGDRASQPLAPPGALFNPAAAGPVLGGRAGRGLELGLGRGAGVPPALNLAWRSRSGLLSSSCVIREYFWDWQLQASLSLRPDSGGLLGTWRLEVGGRRGKRPWLWEGAGKAGSPEQEARPQAGEAAGAPPSPPRPHGPPSASVAHSPRPAGWASTRQLLRLFLDGCPRATGLKLAKKQCCSQRSGPRP